MATTPELAAPAHPRARLAAAAGFFTQGFVFISLTTRLPKVQDHWHYCDTTLSLLLLMMVLLAGLTHAEIDDDLAEWDYGDLEGRTSDDIRSELPGWSIWQGPWPGGETAEQITRRVDRLLDRVLAEPPGSKVALVAHGHLLRVVVPAGSASRPRADACSASTPLRSAPSVGSTTTGCCAAGT